ncbi:MAG: hypothetical protein QM346_12565 [Chloroflexota bacterium]|nr:hypothetical protein [Chloroflexota bacterium]
MAIVVARLTHNRFPEIAAKLPREAAKITEKTALRIEETAKTSMAGPKSGRMYGAHQASAPGESPAIDTSNLANSIGTEAMGGASHMVYAGTEYALSLEFGSPRVAPRPFLGPAASQEEPEFLREMADLERRLR